MFECNESVSQERLIREMQMSPAEKKAQKEAQEARLRRNKLETRLYQQLAESMNNYDEYVDFLDNDDSVPKRLLCLRQTVFQNITFLNMAANDLIL